MLAEPGESLFWALGVSHSCSTVLHGKPFRVLTKDGKEAANDVSHVQITFLRHGRSVLGALRFQLGARRQTLGVWGFLPVWVVHRCDEKNKECGLRKT